VCVCVCVPAIHIIIYKLFGLRITTFVQCACDRTHLWTNNNTIFVHNAYYYLYLPYTQRRVSCVFGEFNKSLDNRGIIYNFSIPIVTKTHYNITALVVVCIIYRIPYTLLYDHLTLDVHIVSYMLCSNKLSKKSNRKNIYPLAHNSEKKTYTSQFEFFKSSTNLYIYIYIITSRP